MKYSIFRTRFVQYLIVLSIITWFLFSFLIKKQSTIMFKYFTEKPPVYYVRAESMALLICFDFKNKLSSPSLKDIRTLIDKYNGPPSLAVDFIYEDRSGAMRSVFKNDKKVDLIDAEYVYPINYGNLKGKLLVYDMNTQFKEKFEEYRHITNITKAFFIITLLLLLSILLFREYAAEVEKQKHIAISEKRDAEWRAKHDSATGLFNQKYFKTTLQEEILRSQKYKRPLTLIMCDIDHFKKFNDTYGHLTGDEVLQMVARIIADNVRACDIVARYGGEEFAVLLLGGFSSGTENSEVRYKTLTDKTVQIAGRIKGRVGQSRIRGKDKQLGLTISLGISSYDGIRACKAEHFIHESDQALYRSKENGRNQITLFDPATKEYKTYL